MRTWTAQKQSKPQPEAVLDLLTDTDACRRWSPVPFDLDGEAGGRLAAGARVRVSGSLVGRRVGFDVEVHEAADGRLALSRARSRRLRRGLRGAARIRGGSEVHASVSLRSAGGLFGRAAEHATAALLHAGALRSRSTASPRPPPLLTPGAQAGGCPVGGLGVRGRQPHAEHRSHINEEETT